MTCREIGKPDFVVRFTESELRRATDEDEARALVQAHLGEMHAKGARWATVTRDPDRRSYLIEGWKRRPDDGSDPEPEPVE